MVLIFRSGLSSLNIYYSDVDHIIAAKYEALHIYMIVRPSPRDNSLFYDKKSERFSSLTLGKEIKAVSKIIDPARPKTQWMTGPL